jgi:hypothetical protein
MTDLIQDTKALHDVMDDFSSQYGDQELIEGMRAWLKSRMGVAYELVTKAEDLPGYYPESEVL